MKNKIVKNKGGRPYKHGGYSLIARDEILKEQYPRVLQYLEDTREGLVKCVAGSEDRLTEQQRVLIDRIISKLSVCRLIEVYVERYGAFRRDKMKQDNVFELEPALGQSYLAFSNAIDRGLSLLGVHTDKSKEVHVRTLEAVVEELEAKRENKNNNKE